MNRAAKWFNRTFRTTLSGQLVASFLGMFLLIFAVSSGAAYVVILNMLKTNAIENNERQFSQLAYNLDDFAEEVDQISRQLVLGTDLQKLIEYGSVPDVDRMTEVVAAFRNFSQVLINYPYVRAISFYGADGYIMHSNKSTNGTQFDADSQTYLFYRTEIYEKVRSKKQALVWFGGMQETQFDIAPEDSPRSPKLEDYYMTAARSVTANGKTGTLMIHVDMRQFTDIYNHGLRTSSNELYMMDTDDAIVSHRDPERIGQHVDGLKMPTDGQFASQELGGVQFTTYMIDSLGFVLVNEIPVSAFIKDILTLRQVMLTTFAFSLLSAFFLSRFWIRRLTRPMSRLTTAMKKLEQGKLGVTFDLELHNELGIMIRQFNMMSRSIAELVEQKESIQEEKRKLELGALQAQINPHFFYNTLNTIKWMALVIKADNIAESVTTLSNLLHPTFRSTDILCTLQEEVDYIDNYIHIMNYRFAGGVKLKKRIPESLKNCQVLRFLLQPLVENAILHGLDGRSGGEITILADDHPVGIVIEVKDNGNGMSEERLQEVQASIAKGGETGSRETGIGLRNVHRRIQLHFGDTYQLQIDCQPMEGMNVRLLLPKVQKS
ncbi:cache domain-containing sensor histidine kinase [Cohnella fermenti]|uniref:histidine kinase n=1 Tax=Cohnella fermenti TaxID=2565925 RepID=A0A4S4BPD0_9BACL|nr:sensor histidine kinase [Cohnella fermenti]THF74417.1 sensor histidine kinase [Cohnella fermenti]